MKLISRIIVISTLLIGQIVSASDTHRGGNGGNSIAGHFTTIATNISYVWEDICVMSNRYYPSCDHLGHFKDLLSKSSNRYVTVKSEKKVVARDGLEREAVNDGLSNITVSETKWLEMNNSPNQSSRRIKLVMHEFLTIVGIDDSDFYEGSNTVLGYISRKGYDLDILAKDQLLPRRCSINIKGDYYNFLNSAIKYYLEEKNYEISNYNEKSRYTLEVNTECFDNAINWCDLKVQLKDNLKKIQTPVVETTRRGIFTSTSKLIQKLLFEYQSENIKNCTL